MFGIRLRKARDWLTKLGRSNVRDSQTRQPIYSHLVTKGAWIVGCASIAGCALSYVDTTGQRHVVGLVHVTMPHHTSESLTGRVSWVRFQSIGLSLVNSDMNSSIGIGYHDTSLVSASSQSCLVVPRIDEIGRWCEISAERVGRIISEKGGEQ
jgi:hypothetical protein